MNLKTILNRVHKLKSFVYGAITIVEAGENKKHVEVEIQPRANGVPECSGCGFRGAGRYDLLPKRRYEFIPLWGMRVFFLYSPRRVNCPRCGVTVERVPWAKGKCQESIPYKLFLAHWAKKLSWKEVATQFKTTWDQVFSAIEYVVQWGLEHRDLSGVTAVGVDEICTNKGHHYATVVYQLDADSRRLLWVGQKRTEDTLRSFFADMGAQVTTGIRYICSDMWKPYLKVIREMLPHAVHILDRFHIVANLNKALDEVRAKEAKRLAANGYEPILKGSRWCFLKSPENLTDNQDYTLGELLKYNLKTVRAYLLKEDFQQLWRYSSAVWAGRFLDRWCTRVMRSRIEPLKKQARSIRKHKQLILNWFRAKKQFNAGIVEGLNGKAKLTMRKAYGFRTFNALQIALFHQLGELPQPEMAHKFF